ncbi:hypothetical protein RclHR1_00110013 [Rhizophagus clarus]|uniref:Uncharacterized protein n=1 Tax=Rhizophagus clarus TaxID=94130 RepID=A0A2Z6Q320_9GLOM|nr:hypothetical protein RclHR1_00110013 [Rhizophagus clarus]GES98009.1 hypothetical protein GLOIN_2v1765031 [Rhizophagus clarus]
MQNLNMNFNNQHQIFRSRSQENDVMAEYSFFYKACNDFQIYHIICKEISFDVISRLLSNNDVLIQNNVQPINSHVFYFQHPDDKKIYKIISDLVSYNKVIWMLNKINYSIELNSSEQHQETFSREHKENLEFHLKRYLTNYLAPTNSSTSQQHIINQPLDYSQGHINTNI